MTAAGPRPVSAYLVDSDDDDAGLERASVTRSEALELAERFWTATLGYADGRIAEGVELTLSFTRHQEDDFIELSTFGPDGVSARHRFIDAWKLLWLVPMRDRRDLHFVLRRREEIVEFVEAYMTMADPAAFRAWMRARGAVLARRR
jgi:hypothetical protein